nr:uncharacterized protein LOC128688513 [Cherax quadricarinatus]
MTLVAWPYQPRHSMMSYAARSRQPPLPEPDGVPHRQVDDHAPMAAGAGHTEPLCDQSAAEAQVLLCPGGEYVGGHHADVYNDARMYNLHKYADNLSLPSTFRSISRGRVMILAVKRDAGLNMPRGVRDLLQELGSFRTHLLPFRGYMSWVFTSWGPSWGECVVDHTGFSQGKTTVDSGSSLRKTTRNVSTYLGEISDQSGSSLDTVYYSQSSSEQALFRLIKETDIYASPVHLEVTVPLLRKGDCWGSPDGREAERRTFCRNFDGYGDLCNCDHPAPLTYAPKQLENSVIDDVPVVIIASSRPQALYRCLVTVLRQEGGVISKILVLLDGYNPEMVALLRLLQVNHRVHHMGSESFVTSGARISLHYRYALHAVFSTFPAASKAIILEEDILAAPDFFSYFNQTSWLLDTDPSIFCISAWNDLGSLHIARHISRLYRVETHAGYGWMLTRKLFNEIYPLWQHPNKVHGNYYCIPREAVNSW